MLARSFTSRVVVGLSLNCATYAIACGQPAIHSVGTLPGGDDSVAKALSSDGSAVVGDVVTSTGVNHAYRWTLTGGMQDLGTLGGPYSQAYSVSADGEMVVGWATRGDGYPGAFRWTSTGGMQDIGTLGGQGARAYGISSNGQFITGDAASGSGAGMAFRWSSTSGMLGLGSIGGSGSFGTALNADGTVVVGEATYTTGQPRAFRWTAATGMQNLGTLGGYRSHGVAVSADGEVVVGDDYTAAQKIQAMRWTAAGGIQHIGDFGGGESQGFGVSADGSVVSGFATTVSGASVAFLWTQATGLFDLNAYLDTLGVDMSEWYLTRCAAISADGTALAGEGWYQGEPRGWVVTGLPSLCLPTITTQPYDVSACPGGSASITVFTAASGGLTFQWHKAGVPIDTIANPTAATNVLAITGVSGTDEVPYYVQITNACGTVTSRAATLTICHADFDCSGFVDIEDYTAFILAFEDGSDDADFDESGFVDIEDFSSFVFAFEAGC